MKKRLRRKKANLHKKRANACDDCHSQFVIRDFHIHHDENLGDFIVPGKHQECPRCGLARYTGEMWDILDRMKAERTRELLLKNYPPENSEYIGEDEMCELENCGKEESKDKFYYNRWVYYLDIGGKRFYLKKSYELFRQSRRPGFFDLTYRHK